MNIETIEIPSKRIVGISVRADNSESGIMKIQALWQKFYDENIPSAIPNKINEDVFAIYSNYEKDFTKAYTLTIGCQVAMDALVSDWLTECVTQDQKYAVFTARGKMPQAIISTWHTIWGSQIKRKYTYDFEHYSDRFSKEDNAEMEIYIAI